MGLPIDKTTVAPGAPLAVEPPRKNPPLETSERRVATDHFTREKDPVLVPAVRDLTLPVGHPASTLVSTELRRVLDTAAPTQAGRPAHLSAGSGLVVVGHYAFVVADDELFLGRFPLDAAQPGELFRLFAGELPLEPKARKAAKADFESLSFVSPRPELPHGALLAIGSDARPARRRAALVPLDAQGTPEVGRPIDLSLFYGALVKKFPELNLEGSAIVGDRLFLAQRGNGAAGQNALIEVDLGAVLNAARSGKPLPSSALRSIVDVELGSLAGTRLGFTDLTPLPDGRLLFAAAAEVTDDPYCDGEVKGSILGVLDRRGHLSDTWLLAPLMKVEGVQASVGANGGVRVLMVTDGDNPEVPADLREAVLPPLTKE